MEQQKCRQFFNRKPEVSPDSKRQILRIEMCYNCHQHYLQNSHDETIFDSLFRAIITELGKNELKHVKIAKNKPFKYMASADSKISAYKSSYQEKHNYLNLHTKKVERFPRIGAFEVYFDNFVVFSMLQSSFRVVLNAEDKNQSKDQPIVIESTGESQNSQKEKSDVSVISVDNLSQVIVQVIRILLQNSIKVDFLSRIQNVFRFLQLEWKPISYGQSLVEYMLKNTNKQNLASVSSILQPLTLLTDEKHVKIKQFSIQTQSPKKVLPYTYFNKVQKTSRIRSIYQDKARKNPLTSESRLITHQKKDRSVIKPNSSKKEQFVKQPNLSIQHQPSIKKINRTFHKSLANRKTSSALFQIKHNATQQKSQEKVLKAECFATQQKSPQKVLKAQGFIVKRNFKKTNVPNFQPPNRYEQKENFEMTETQRENSGFIYKNNKVKESLVTNQINFKNTSNTNLNQNISRSSLNRDQNVGKICMINLKSNQQKSNKEMPSQKRNYQSFQSHKKLFKRSKVTETAKNQISQKYKSKNLVKNCISQRRPLSSTIASKILARKQSATHNNYSISQRQIKVKNFREIFARKTESQSRDKKNIIFEPVYQIRSSEQTQTKHLSSQQQIISVRSKQNEVKPIQQRRFSKDFVKQNIRKASMTKRVNNHRLSASLWQNFAQQSKQKQKKKSFSYFKKKKSQKIVRALSSNDQIKQFSISDRFFAKEDEDVEKKLEKCVKSKSNSSRSKSQKSYYEKGYKQVEFEKIQDFDQKIAGDQEKSCKISVVKVAQKVEESISAKQTDICIKQEHEDNDSSKKSEKMTPKKQILGQNRISQQKNSFNKTSSLITHTLKSSDDQSQKDRKQSAMSYMKTISYYNHQLYLSLETGIKYEPAYITHQMNYEDALMRSENFAKLLTQKDFPSLQKLSKFSFDNEEIYQQYTIKSLRQLYKLDQLKLFPPQWAKSLSFHLEDLRSHNQSQNSSILAKTLHILAKITPKLISRLFENVKSLNFIGYYGVWLYDLTCNKFEIVIVDDDFCVVSSQECCNSENTTENQFIFSEPLSQNTVWYMILEKAVAKALGGYGKLYQASFPQLFKVLTGCQYVQFKDLSLQKLSKIFNQKILHNKKSAIYATLGSDRSNLIHDDSGKCKNSVQKITGWSFNEKNPFLSMVHFESENKRIQSLTMLDFSRQFEGITVVFFNPSFCLNHVSLEMQNSLVKTGKKLRVIQIVSNSYAKDNLCYISVAHSKIDQISINKMKNSGKSIKTTLKLYKEVHSYDAGQVDHKFGSHIYEDGYSAEALGCTFRYNGQITKGGDFFFEVGLKGGRNLCFIQTEIESLNIAFYSQQKVNVKIMVQDSVNKLKLMDGKAFGQTMNRINKKGDHIQKKNDNVSINQQKGYQNHIFTSKNLNKAVKKEQGIQKKEEKRNRKDQTKKSDARKKQIKVEKDFLEDELLQNLSVFGQEYPTMSFKPHKRR